MITTVTISDGGPTAWIDYYHDEYYAEYWSLEEADESGAAQVINVALNGKQTEELVRRFYLNFESAVSRRRNGVIDWRVE